MKTIIKIELTKSQQELLAHYGAFFNEKDLDTGEFQDWYFLPFWFKKINGSDFEMYRLSELPESLVSKILEIREKI